MKVTLGGAILLVLAALVPAAGAQQAPTVVLRPGMVITRSVRVAPRRYRLPAPASRDSALVVIRGDDITVDFTGADLQGTAPDADPDAAQGVAIRVEGGRNVRIVGARVRGYQVALLARGTNGLTISGGDFSYNWKPRLFSLVEHESLVDWLSFHHNERGEWLRFGAAIYLDGVTGGEIRGNRAVQGMNGLLMNRSQRLRVEGNDFSYNSGLGIGLYRSSDNTIVYNTVEYDVRGYSHGFYRRGQDSAGILMYEQSCRNLVAWNTVTHGGDGLFLWAGQSTMDSGTGGANDNLFVGNDFSFAPANGIEATFSRNTFIDNRLEGNEYGAWAGYSFEARFYSNAFIGNRTGIAIEHGQDSVIAANRFFGDSTAINLWANPIEPSDWGYPRHRDTRSRDYRIENNLFVSNRVAVRAASTSGLTLLGNTWPGIDSVTVLRDTSGFRSEGNITVFDARPRLTSGYPLEARARADSLEGPQTRPRSDRARLPRSAIVVDEWGPYDGSFPKLWPPDSTRALPLRLAVLGPAGRWRVVSRRGLGAVSQLAGRTGDTMSVMPERAALGDWELVLEYRGSATVSPRGERRVAGVPVRFSYGRFEPPAGWSVRFFAWTDSTSPIERPTAFAALLGGTPLLTTATPRLDYLWYRPTIPGLPRERFALEATAAVVLEPGEYSLRAISDDGVRVWLDGALAIDNWTPHESLVDYSAPLSGGRHDLKVWYYQRDGWTELRLEIVRGRQRARGSPGPH